MCISLFLVPNVNTSNGDEIVILFKKTYKLNSPICVKII